MKTTNYREKCGEAGYTLAGHSFGAYLSIHYALKFPASISKIHFMSGPGIPPKPEEYDTKSRPLSGSLSIKIKKKLTMKIFEHNWNPMTFAHLAGSYGTGKFLDGKIKRMVILDT